MPEKKEKCESFKNTDALRAGLRRELCTLDERGAGEDGQPGHARQGRGDDAELRRLLKLACDYGFKASCMDLMLLD